MKSTDINKKGKKEKGQKVKAGDCIFPFKYKWKQHNECIKTEKGEICATSISDRGTLKTYGYCEKPQFKLPNKQTNSRLKHNLKKGTKKKKLKKTLKKKKKLIIVDKFSPKSKSLKSISKEEKLKLEYPIKNKEIVEMDLKLSPKGKTMNKELIDIMEELADIMTRQGEPFKARAYKKASETIMAFPGEIINVSVLQNKPGIGKTIMDKLDEFQKTGTLRILEKERKNPMNIFTKIYGVGPKKAKQLIDNGITSIEQLKENKSYLNDTQKIGLKYYEPLLQRIPRNEITEFEKVFQRVFNEVTPSNSKFEIVGSYRREAKNSGDIDVIITNQENNIEAFNKLLDSLIKDGVVIEVLTRGKTKSLTIGKIKGSVPRRIDFLYTPPTEYAFATLYFTGSKAFNTVMRQRALDMGYTLNEHGLSLMKFGKKAEKVNIEFPTEESIFQFLGMKYKEPKEREGYKSIELLDNTEQSKTKEEEQSKTKEGEQSKPKEEKFIKEKTKSKKVFNNKTIKVKKDKSGFKEHIEQFKQNGIDTLKLLTEKQMETILDEAQKYYYNDPENTLLTDNEYDIIKEYMEKKYPKNKVLDQIGAPIQDKNKVKLPYFMASMDKIKPDTNALQKWKDKYKGPYVLSAKLDGISGLYSNENNEQKLYTRGNGEVGQDISHLIPFLRLPTTPDITIRGELIMKKSTFIEKYKDLFSNSRNLVSGLVNQKKMEPEKIKDIDFVAYEVIKPILKPSEQMKFLDDKNVDKVIHETKKNIDNTILSEILVDWREKYEYTIDGVIVENDEIYKRSEENPKHAFAFKMVLSDQIAEAKVLNVLWAPSKDGYLKPRIQIEPVVLGGAKIEYATAFNAAFVEDNKIGIGALVKLVRSGDVIPHIMEVIEPAEKAKMPDVAYKWNETHVDIILEDAEQDETVKEKNISGFFKGLEVEGLGPGNVKKIIKAGYKSVPQIIAMTQEDFLKVEGFKKKMAEKVYKSIHEKIDTASLPKIMAVSNIFGRGFGEKRIEPILSKYPDILTSSENDQDKIDKIKSIKGIENKTAERFVNNISKFMDFIQIAKLQNKLSDIPIEEPKDESHRLYEKTIIITGFRDKELSEKLKSIGAKESSSVTKNTFAVIVKNKDEETGKTEAAKEKNIPLYTVDEFKEKFDLQ
jgi:NAD-dependent DNA ligase